MSRKDYDLCFLLCSRGKDRDRCFSLCSRAGGCFGCDLHVCRVQEPYHPGLYFVVRQSVGIFFLFFCYFYVIQTVSC